MWAHVHLLQLDFLSLEANTFFFFANTSLKFFSHSLNTSHFIKAKETHAAMAPIGAF